MTQCPVVPVFSLIESAIMMERFLLNCGAIRCSGIEVLSRSVMTQPPPASDAGSCKGGCDRHQLSMSNYYSKEKVDAGQRLSTDKSQDIKQNA